MEILFDSKTGNVKRFLDNVKLPSRQIEKGLITDSPFILVTYTTGLGQLPPITKTFLESNSSNLKGVAASGNKIWGNNFAISADQISDMYGVPILLKFEMSGTPTDVRTFIERVQNIETY